VTMGRSKFAAWASVWSANVRPYRFLPLPRCFGVDCETMTEPVQESTRLSASTTVHVRFVVPTGNREPDTGKQLAPMGEAPPESVGAKFTTTGFPESDVAVGFGQVIAGGGGGPETITTALHEADRCNVSTTLQVSDVEPTGKSDPDAGEQVVVTGERPPTTTGANVTITGLPSSDEAVGAAQLIDGGFAAVKGVCFDASADGSLITPAAL
jgi:hypothetical protein